MYPPAQQKLKIIGVYGLTIGEWDYLDLESASN
jgi:hypothetical protein